MSADVIIHMLGIDGYDITVKEVDGMTVVTLNDGLAAIVVNGPDVTLSFLVMCEPSHVLNIAAIVDSCCVEDMKIVACSQHYISQRRGILYNEDAIRVRDAELAARVFIEASVDATGTNLDRYMDSIPDDEIPTC